MRRGLVRAVFARVGRAFALALLVTLMGAGSVLAGMVAPERPPPAPAVTVPSTPGLFRPIVGPAAPGIATDRARGEQVTAAALKQVGAPYRWNGMTPSGFDCSGLVAFVYRTVGITLPRDVIGQVTTGRPVEPSAAYLTPGRRWRHELVSSLGCLGWRDRVRLLREVVLPRPRYMLGAYGVGRSGVVLLPALYAHRAVCGAWKILAGRK